MTLEQWAEHGWLRTHSTSQQEIAGLLAIVKRDLSDAGGNISADSRFAIAYNGALGLCTILLYASGFRPPRDAAHYRTIQALPLILGAQRKPDADYLESCRRKRNTVGYDKSGAATDDDVRELVAFTRELHADVMSWLKRERPALLSP